MYPTADQLLRWRGQDEQRESGGLVMEAKGDFGAKQLPFFDCTGRSSAHIEIGLDTDTCY